MQQDKVGTCHLRASKRNSSSDSYKGVEEVVGGDGDSPLYAWLHSFIKIRVPKFF